MATRLPLIFPEGTPNRNYCVRELAASTVFTAIYIGAVEGAEVYLGPVHVYRMTDSQAITSEDEARVGYRSAAIKQKNIVPGRRWYADNTREPIRDETLRDGLVNIGAMLRREDLPTTSGAPRYALKPDFARLFDPSLQGDEFAQAVAHFQATHLSKSALARVSIMLSGAGGSADAVLVMFPNKETRSLAPGPSSVIAKAVVETFATRYLRKPAVLWLSESGNKVVARDDKLATAIGLKIEADKNLPDLILVDLDSPEPLLVFVEVVATDGAITERRKQAIYSLVDKAGLNRRRVAFLTAYLDRDSQGFRKTMSSIAWGSLIWLVSEPQHVIALYDGEEKTIHLEDLI